MASIRDTSGGRPALTAGFLKLPLAHRGLHDLSAKRAENSLSAAEAAIAGGFGIEVDLQLSKDGIAVVFHDSEMFRLTHHQGRVRDFLADDLTQIELRDGGGDRIPTLKDFLAHINGRAPVLIELKDQSGCFGAEEDTLARSVSEAVQTYSGPVALMSFNPHNVAHLARLAPDIPRGLTTQRFRPRRGLSLRRAADLSAIRHFDAVGASFVSHDRRSLHLTAVTELRARGFPVLTWTIRSPRDEEKARRVAHNVTFEGYIPNTTTPIS